MSSVRSQNILVTAVGTTNAISVLKCLRADGQDRYHLTGTDIHEDRFLAGLRFVDEFFQVPPASDPEYLTKMISICRQDSIDTIIPIHDAEVEILAKAKAPFATIGTKIMAADARVVQLCNDKMKLNSHLIENGFPAVPSYYPGNTLPDFPLFLKPRFGNGSRDCHVLQDRNELKTLAGLVEDPIVQPLITGEKLVVDCLYSSTKEVFIAAPRIEYEAKAGIGTKIRTVRNPDLEDLCKRLLSFLKLEGPCNIEFIDDGKDSQLIEINPRFSAGLVFTHLAGIPMAHLTLDLLNERTVDIEKMQWKYDLHINRYWSESIHIPA
jgi:carbamoyl-phosphate synthase large subunit